MRLILPLLFPAALLLAQLSPTVGIIDFYGAHNVRKAELRKALGVTEGARFPASKAEIEERLEAIDGVVSARIEAACCEDGKAILYVGIEERGAPHFDFRTEPDQDLTLPAEIVKAYTEFLEAAQNAARTGRAAEDLTRGHSLVEDPKVRYIQLGFAALADQHIDQLYKVLRNAVDAEQRAIAAYVIGYAKDKKAVAEDLQYALRDPDETVRANALRALAAIAVYTQKNKDAGFTVSPTWLIEMLNSVVWTDRNNAAVALVTVTESRDPGVLQHVRERALPALVEMARWQHLPHALPAFIIVGRAAGLTEAQLQDAWKKGDRESVIRRAAAKK